MLTVAIAVFAREIVALISPATYAPAATIVPLIALGYALNGLYMLMVTGMGIAKKAAPLAWVVGGAAIGNVGVNVVLIPPWGMRAAAITTVLANAIMVAGVWYYSHKVYPIPYDWSKIIRTVIIGAIVVSAVAFAAPGHGFLGIIIAVLAWIVFVALLIKTAVISSDETAAIRAKLQTFWHGARRRWARQGVAS
jgi:O-antigen/teichoic acid export membrane protein